MTDDDAWVDREYVGVDFRDDDLSRVRTERVVFTECDFSALDGSVRTLSVCQSSSSSFSFSSPENKRKIEDEDDDESEHESPNWQ